jgi:hypothetical protein
MRRAGKVAVWVVVAMLGLSGLSYAGTGAPDPVGTLTDAVRSAFSEDTPVPDLSDLQPQVQQVDEPEATVTGEEDDPETADENGEPASTGPVWSTEGCEGFTGNHGQYVSQSPEGGESRSEAARSPCGKPVQAEGRGDEGDAEPEPEDADAGQGRPDDAGPPEWAPAHGRGDADAPRGAGRGRGPR